MFIELSVETKHNMPKELEIVSTLRDLQLKYQNLPIFTQKIMVESGAAPHSHPVLTLNTKETTPLGLLKQFVHEQFHWYAEASPLYTTALSNLKTTYKDLGDWEHLIVCWNTRNTLTKLLDPKEVTALYSQAQAYPLIEKFVADNFEKIKIDLSKFDLVSE